MKNKIYLSILFMLFCLVKFTKAQESYEVGAATLNMRSGPDKSYDIIITLNRGDALTLIEKETQEWWLVEKDGNRGYVFSSLLNTKDDSKTNWEKKNYESGTTPECENVIPQYDYNLDNYLKVKVGSNTDVVIKLMQRNFSGQDVCVRIVFIRSGDIFYVKNIPESEYYLKIAYGKDWQQRIVNYQCYGKFMKNPKYEKGSEILDFNIRKTYDGEQVPSYELFLDIVASKYERNTYHSNNINETEFNK